MEVAKKIFHRSNNGFFWARSVNYINDALYKYYVFILLYFKQGKVLYVYGVDRKRSYIFNAKWVAKF